jgi:hypothetical protein
MKKTIAVLVAVVGIGALTATALAQSHEAPGGGIESTSSAMFPGETLAVKSCPSYMLGSGLCS